LLIKGSDSDSAVPCRLHYRDIGDYLSREQQLAILADQDLDTVDWQQLTPSPEGDWINQRDERFATFTPIGDKTTSADGIFALYSSGLKSNRDAWVYNFSERRLRRNVKATIGFYNQQVADFKTLCTSAGIAKPTAEDVERFIDLDPKKMSWNRADKVQLRRVVAYSFEEAAIRESAYRPFVKQQAYFQQQMNDMIYQLPRMFPTLDQENFGFYVTGLGTGRRERRPGPGDRHTHPPQLPSEHHTTQCPSPPAATTGTPPKRPANAHRAGTVLTRPVAGSSLPVSTRQHSGQKMREARGAGCRRACAHRLRPQSATLSPSKWFQYTVWSPAPRLRLPHPPRSCNPPTKDCMITG
jgi:Type ISP C-terminal specificity domain